METLEQLSDFISRVASDQRLRPTHISLYFALCHSWIVNKFQQRFQVSRRRLMMLSKIRSRATYHNIMDDLKDLGYVKYRPSFHPVKGSEVSLVDAGNPFKRNHNANRERIPLFTTLDDEVKGLDKQRPDLVYGDKHFTG